MKEVWCSIKVLNITYSDLLKTTSIINFSHVALCSLGSPSKLSGKDCPMEGGKDFLYWFVSLAGGVHHCGHDQRTRKPSKAFVGIRKEDSNIQELGTETFRQSQWNHITSQFQFSDIFTSQIHLTELLGIHKENSAFSPPPTVLLHAGYASRIFFLECFPSKAHPLLHFQLQSYLF